MPRFEPFAGLRYDAEAVAADDVVAPPYDVIGPEEQARLEARSPYNAVRVELPRDEAGRDRYEAAKVLLHEWQAAGVLNPDDAPSLYVYRMEFADEEGRPRHTTGVIGAMELSVPGETDVLPHERTMPKPKSDRLDLLRSTQTNLSPIWGLSLASGLSDLLPTGSSPLMQATDDEGVVHKLWRISDPGVMEKIAATVAAAPVVIADGHHRYETGLAYQRERRAANGDAAGDHDLLMTYVVELVEDELTVRAIHRLLTNAPADILAALEPFFDLTEGAPESTDVMTLITREGSWHMTARPDTAAQAEHDLDSSRLDVALATMPGVDVTYQHGIENVVDAVRSGAADAAVVLRPATVEQIAQTAHARARMPEKTTFFYPKLRTGFVFRRLAN